MTDYNMDSNMKHLFKLISLALVMLFFTACQDSNNKKPYVIHTQQTGVNPNSMAYLSQDKALDRKNKIEMAEIEAKSKIEVAKVESKKAVEIAKINSETTKDVTKQTAVATLAVTELDKKAKEQEIMVNLYIAIGVLIAVLIGFFLWYRHKKKSLEVKAKLEENRLKHELEIKDKELKEQRMHKILDLAMSGQLPVEMQQEVLHSITRPDSKLIESK